MALAEHNQQTPVTKSISHVYGVLSCINIPYEQNIKFVAVWMFNTESPLIVIMWTCG